MLAMPQDRMDCIYVEGSGCYGHAAADDAGADEVCGGRARAGGSGGVRCGRGLRALGGKGEQAATGARGCVSKSERRLAARLPWLKSRLRDGGNSLANCPKKNPFGQ
jgi:hypothetical protein